MAGPQGSDPDNSATGNWGRVWPELADILLKETHPKSRFSYEAISFSVLSQNILNTVQANQDMSASQIQPKDPILLCLLFSLP